LPPADFSKVHILQAFYLSVPEGTAARRLYLESGFADLKDGGPNPAGIPTVIMELPAIPKNQSRKA